MIAMNCSFTSFTSAIDLAPNVSNSLLSATADGSLYIARSGSSTALKLSALPSL